MINIKENRKTVICIKNDVVFFYFFILQFKGQCYSLDSSVLIILKK